MDPKDGFEFSDHPERHRFELRSGGELAAFSEYNVLKTGLLFTHTEVLPAFEGYPDLVPQESRRAYRI